MGLNHYIIAGFRRIIGSYPLLNLPGGVFHGTRAEMDNPQYPLALIQVTEASREYHSGGGALVVYTVKVTVYAQGGQQHPSITTEFLSAVFSKVDSLPEVNVRVGRKDFLVSIIPTANTVEEEPDTELGQDTLAASISWDVSVNEHEYVLTAPGADTQAENLLSGAFPAEDSIEGLGGDPESSYGPGIREMSGGGAVETRRSLTRKGVRHSLGGQYQ